jgi:hypothetical protein
MDDDGDLVGGGGPENTGVAGGLDLQAHRDEPEPAYDAHSNDAFDDHDVLTAPAPGAHGSELVEPVDVAPQPMDDFEEAMNDANEIEDAFDAMVEELE